MATPAWPSAVPFRYRAGSYSETLNGGVLRSPMDSGRAKTRRQFASTVKYRHLTLLLSVAEKDALMNWIDSTIGGGALEFTWAVPLGGGATETVRLVVPDAGFRPRRLDRQRTAVQGYALSITAEVMP